MKNIFNSSFMKKKNKKAGKEKEDIMEREDDLKIEDGIADEKANENETETEEVDENEQLKEKANELNEKFLRLYSEFDNYRKRTIKEKNDLSKYATSQLIEDLLPVLDDFERALKNIEKNEQNAPIIEGVELIFNKFFKTLENRGLKAIKSLGETFDTDFHEAITQVPAENENMKGKVFDEVQKGYMIHDKIIRYSKVVVAE